MRDSENTAKERILNAAAKLFSERGFDGTTVSEIARKAEVNKALIYYYFQNKADILDNLVQFLLENVVGITIDYIYPTIEKMAAAEALVIKPDRIYFADQAAAAYFMDSINKYYAKVLDYALEHRKIIRIIMLESLKENENRNDLFKMLDYTRDSENKLYKSIVSTKEKFTYTDDLELFRFFFLLIPLFNFAAYCDEYQAVAHLTEDELKASFIRSFQIITSSLVSGSDILLRNENSAEGGKQPK